MAARKLLSSLEGDNANVVFLYQCCSGKGAITWCPPGESSRHLAAKGVVEEKSLSCFRTCALAFKMEKTLLHQNRGITRLLVFF
ncbi:hypothetical protein PR202_gb10785 [Eleusine coracana subsp. coracana]|uniref:Uncharacterized protein n=1 Tax=Eleusine coracana subsp. coracana TaxID=191504 RepID=A0AAV5ELT3_ELECO|nr:hypothetical protein PR202_gb10785 [Eleusine coracana subsp. coracana]